MACLIGMLLLATPGHATRGSLNYPKVLMYSSAIGDLPPAVQDTLSWYDVLVCASRPEIIRSLRQRNPTQRYLWSVLPQYVEPPEGDDVWWMPDTLWSIKRLLIVYAWKNDWYLRDTHGEIVTDGTAYLINWTRFCPAGTFGSAKGLRAAEWIASVALPTIALSERYWEPWRWDSYTTYNGYMFEILADCLGSYGWENYKDADPDQDGDADGVYSNCSTGGTDDPLSVLFREENEIFYQRLKEAFPATFVFAISANYDYIGPWWVHRLSGIKIENWMRFPSNPDWVDWWDHFYGQTRPWEGQVNHGGGYAWAESEFDKPVHDRLKGWDLSIIQTWRNPDVPESENLRQMRWGLGTTMLGDGYFCYSEDARYPLWQPEFDWDFGAPRGKFLRRVYGSDSLYVRVFSKGMVEVNPNDWPVNKVPPRDSRFTLWRPAGSLPDSAGAAETGAAGLLSCSPNPFTSNLQLTYQLSRSGPVLLQIYDAQGRRVRTLMEADRAVGMHTAVWDGRDEQGRPVPAGVYHGRLKLREWTDVVKVVLTR